MGGNQPVRRWQAVAASLQCSSLRFRWIQSTTTQCRKYFIISLFLNLTNKYVASSYCLSLHRYNNNILYHDVLFRNFEMLTDMFKG